MTSKRRSQKQEKSVAKDMNARVTPASGAKWGQKGDVRSEDFLIECKTTNKDYYSITTKVWEKIRLEATQDHGRIPLLVIDLRDQDRYVVFRPQDLDMDINTYEAIPHVHGGCKSFKFSGYTDSGLPLLFSLNPDKMNLANHILMVMSYADFSALNIFDKKE